MLISGGEKSASLTHAQTLLVDETLSAQVLRTLACEDVSLVQQCRSLEFYFGTNHLQSLLQNPDAALAILKAAKRHTYYKD